MRLRPYNDKIVDDAEIRAIAAEVAAVTGEDVSDDLCFLVEQGITRRPTAIFSPSYSRVSPIRDYRRLSRGDEILIETTSEWIHGRVRDTSHKGVLYICDSVEAERAEYYSIDEAAPRLRNELRPTTSDDPLAIIMACDPAPKIYQIR